MRFLFNWLLSGAAVMIAAYLLPGIRLSGFIAALITAIMLGLFNAVIKPVLLLLTLPLTIMTLGLFSLVLNALLIMLASRLIPGFQVQGFWWAVAFSLVLTFINWVLSVFKQ